MTTARDSTRQSSVADIHSGRESEDEAMPSDITQKGGGLQLQVRKKKKKEEDTSPNALSVLVGTHDDGEEGEEGEPSHLSLWQNSH